MSGEVGDLFNVLLTIDFLTSFFPTGVYFIWDFNKIRLMFENKIIIYLLTEIQVDGIIHEINFSGFITIKIKDNKN